MATTKNIQYKIEELSDKWVNNKNIGENEINEFFEMLGSNPDAIDEISYDAFDKMESFMNSQELEAWNQAVRTKAELGELSESILRGLELTQGVIDIGISLDQIKSAREALSQSERPEKVGDFQIDPKLSEALRQAGYDMEDPMTSAQLAPAVQGIQDAYAQNLAQAKTVAGGQAGIYGALGQAAAGQKARASLGLIPMASQVIGDARDRYNELLNMKLYQNVIKDRAKRGQYELDRDDYYRTQEAAGRLGSAGRQNLRTSFSNISDNLAGFGTDLIARLQERSRRNQDVLGDEAADYGDEVIGNRLGIDPSTARILRGATRMGRLTA